MVERSQDLIRILTASWRGDREGFDERRSIRHPF
jgi:hypothetical protein